jgi:hypothetical protein
MCDHYQLMTKDLEAEWAQTAGVSLEGLADTYDQQHAPPGISALPTFLP